jgi:hypothetical protein
VKLPQDVSDLEGVDQWLLYDDVKTHRQRKVCGMIVRTFSDRFVWLQDNARVRRQAKSRSSVPVTDMESVVCDEFGRCIDSEHLLVCATAQQKLAV